MLNARRPRSPLVPFVLAVGLAGASMGCTLAGLGIGSAVPRWQETTPADVRPGEDVRVASGSVPCDQVPENTSCGTQWTRGRLLDTRERDRELVLDTEDGARTFAGPRAIEVTRGSQWARGLLVGAALDLFVVVTLVTVAATSPPPGSGIGAGLGSGGGGGLFMPAR